MKIIKESKIRLPKFESDDEMWDYLQLHPQMIEKVPKNKLNLSGLRRVLKGGLCDPYWFGLINSKFMETITDSSFIHEMMLHNPYSLSELSLCSRDILWFLDKYPEAEQHLDKFSMNDKTIIDLVKKGYYPIRALQSNHLMSGAVDVIMERGLDAKSIKFLNEYNASIWGERDVSDLNQSQFIIENIDNKLLSGRLIFNCHPDSYSWSKMMEFMSYSAEQLDDLPITAYPDVYSELWKFAKFYRAGGTKMSVEQGVRFFYNQLQLEINKDNLKKKIADL